MPRDASIAKRSAFIAGSGALALLVALGVGEIGLRLSGFEAWQPAPLPEVPIMQEPDAELGWRNMPGVYRFDARPPIVMTIWPGGYRATATSRVARATQLLVLGGSFTQGWAVTDGETYADLLQHDLPDREVLNLGTAGYGSLQSLLALERYLASAPRAPSQIVFGFNDFHQERDVAAPAWLRMLSQLSQLGAIAAPYATLTPGGELERHPPLRYPDWPGKRSLAVVALLEERTFELASRARSLQSTAVTEAVLRDMNATAQAAGSQLLVAVLSNFRPDLHRHYLDYLRAQGIANADCAYPDDGTKRLVVPRYGHPNATVNAYWATCIAAALQ